MCFSCQSVQRAVIVSFLVFFLTPCCLQSSFLFPSGAQFKILAQFLLRPHKCGNNVAKTFFPTLFLGCTNEWETMFLCHAKHETFQCKQTCLLMLYPRYFSTKCLVMHKLGNTEGNYVSAIMFPCLPVGGLKCPRIFCCLCSLHPSVHL